MAKSFRDLRARMSPGAQEAAASKAKAMLAGMSVYFSILSQIEHSSSPMGRREHTIKLFPSYSPMQDLGIHRQLNLCTRCEISGAAAGALNNHGETRLGSIFGQTIR